MVTLPGVFMYYGRMITFWFYKRYDFILYIKILPGVQKNSGAVIIFALILYGLIIKYRIDRTGTAVKASDLISKRVFRVGLDIPQVVADTE